MPSLAAPCLPPPLAPRPGAPDGPLARRIRACRLCAPRFAATRSAHAPRPVPWFAPGAPVLIASQAPGWRVHGDGRPFADPSGVRLRDWLGVTEAEFYDPARFAFAPMAFCFPGHDAAGGDLPPPALCAETWRAEVLASLAPRLTLLVGGHAQRWHMGAAACRGGVAATVARWREAPPGLLPLPHPSWRNSGWLARNPWFAEALLPDLRARLREALA